jgi:hypothetical protein
MGKSAPAHTCVSTPTAAQLIAAYQQLVARAHDAGLSVYGMTVLPFGGPYVFTTADEQVRRALNAYIRTAGVLDALADTDAALRDPSNPTNLPNARAIPPNRPVASYGLMVNMVPRPFDPPPPVVP